LWVAKNGRERIVKMPLERRDVCPDQSDSGGRTPLWWAVVNGNNGVVKVLPRQDDVSPDKITSYDRKPL